MPTPLRAAKQTSESSTELQEQIRRRAYELNEQRGREVSRDLDDWLQAESEVTQQKWVLNPPF
jgi:Protein of unknown function (DUF2934)